MRVLYISSLVVTLCSVRASSADGGLSSNIRIPSLGIVYDNGTVRPILGMPGAAILGAPLDLGFPVENAATAAQQDYALATSAGDHRLRLVRMQDGSTVVRTLLDAMVSPDRIIPSASGRAAVVYSRATARLQVISGLPEAPVVSREFTTAGLAVNLAVSDDGKSVLLVAGGQDAGSAWLLNTDTGKFELQLQDATAAICFRPDSRDALAVSRSGEIYLLGSGGMSKFGLIPTTADPVAIQASPDGARAYVAYTDGTLAVIDSGAGTVQTMSCNCKPTGLNPVKLSKMYRINEPSDSTLLLFDASAAGPRIWFVPPDRTLPEIRGNEQ